MNYTVLTTELTTDPLERGYSGMSDAEVAASLNAADIPKRVRVSVPQLAQHLMESGLWPAIITATGEQDTATADAAGLLVDAATAPPDEIDVDSVGLSSALASLVSGGVITQPQRDAIDALAETTTSRAAELGLGTVKPGHVEEVRRPA